VGCSATRPEAGLWADLARGKNRLAKSVGFWEAQRCQTTEFPVSPTGIKPPASGGFALWDWAFRFLGLVTTTRANQFARKSSLPQNPVGFKKADAKPSES